MTDTFEKPAYHQWFGLSLGNTAKHKTPAPTGYQAWLDRHRLTLIEGNIREPIEQTKSSEGLRQQLGRQALREPILAKLLNMAGNLGLRPLLIKGAAMARLPDIYAYPEQRLMNDVDLLIPADELIRFEQLAENLGFSYPYAHDPAIRDYHLREGYALPLCHDDLGLLEIHHRLWRDVPSGFTDGVFSRVVASKSERGSIAMPCLSDLWLISCVHLASQLAFPRWVWLWELYRLGQYLDQDSIRAMVPVVLENRLEIFILAVLHGAEELWQIVWPNPWDELKRSFEEALHPRERRALHTFVQCLPAWSGSRLIAARRLSGAPTRGGRGLLRRIWPHPGAVALSRGVPSTHPLFVRHRFAHGCRQICRMLGISGH